MTGSLIGLSVGVWLRTDWRRVSLNECSAEWPRLRWFFTDLNGADCCSHAFWLARAYLIIPVTWLRIQECHIGAFFISLFDHATSLLGWKIKHYAVSVNNYAASLKSYLSYDAASKLSFSDFSAVNSTVGYYVKFFFLALLAILVMMVYKLSKASRYKTTYTMSSIKASRVI